MKTIKVKELMLPLKDYETVYREPTLREAVVAIEKTQEWSGRQFFVK